MLRLEHGYAELLGARGHGCGQQPATTSRWRVRPGDHPDELVPAGGDRLQGGQCDLGGAGEDDPH
jgi:hypothetical protein